MLDYIIILLMAAAGYGRASPLLILLGIAGLLIGSFWDKITLLRQHPLVPFDWKIGALFAASAFNAACACGAGYFLGVGIRAMLGP